MKRISILAILALVFGLLPAAFAQSQPSQPPDPTAQAPAGQAPTTPPTFPETKGNPSQSPEAQSQSSTETSQAGMRVFTGAIGQGKDGYVLRAGSHEYKLDDQAKAKEFDGKQVKVQGSLDRDTNQIHVDKIEAAPSM